MLSIDFKSGEIVYNEFNIVSSKPLAEQEDLLSEDLLQIQYGDNIILDVGWYPEFDISGNFLVQIIKNQDWSTPVFKKACQNIEELIDTLNYAIVLSHKIQEKVD